MTYSVYQVLRTPSADPAGRDSNTGRVKCSSPDGAALLGAPHGSLGDCRRGIPSHSFAWPRIATTTSMQRSSKYLAVLHRAIEFKGMIIHAYDRCLSGRLVDGMKSVAQTLCPSLYSDIEASHDHGIPLWFTIFFKALSRW